MTGTADIAPVARDRRPKLSDRVVTAMRAEIGSGRLAPGSQLPTEQRLTEAYGVSRTVVREAITRLAADGLVEARQGAGVFVSRPATLMAEAAGKVSMVLNVLEVRMAVEIEAAALAAIRRSPSQDADIQSAFTTFDRFLRRGEPTGTADFDFHRAIAAATNNPFYVEVLDALGRRTIPRDLMTSLSAELLLSPEYQRLLQQEHAAIMEAISQGRPDAARSAMRAHLSASQERYRGMRLTGNDFEALFASQPG